MVPYLLLTDRNSIFKIFLRMVHEEKRDAGEQRSARGGHAAAQHSDREREADRDAGRAAESGTGQELASVRLWGLPGQAHSVAGLQRAPQHRETCPGV